MSSRREVLQERSAPGEKCFKREVLHHVGLKALGSTLAGSRHFLSLVMLATTVVHVNPIKECPQQSQLVVVGQGSVFIIT